MIEVMNKVDEVITIINDSDTLKRLRQLRDEMDKNNELSSLFKHFNELKKEYENTSIITPSFIKSKEELYKHPLVSEYRSILSEVNLSLLKFNNKINSLTNSTSCNKI